MWGMGEGGGRCGVKFVVLASEPIGGDPGRPSCLVIHGSLAAK